MKPVNSITIEEYRAMKLGKAPAIKRSRKEDRTADGITFDSKAELQRYMELKAGRARGAVAWFCHRPCFYLGGARYTADFLWVLAGDCPVVHVEEVKSPNWEQRRDARRCKRNLVQVRNLYGVEVEVVER